MTPTNTFWFKRAEFVHYIAGKYGESEIDANRIWAHLVDTLPRRRKSYDRGTGELLLRIKVDPDDDM